MTQILSQHHFDPTEIQSLLFSTQKSRQAKNLTLVPGQKYAVIKTSNAKTLKFFDSSHSREFVFTKGPHTPAAFREQPAQFDKKLKTIQGKVHGSILAAIQEKTGSTQVGVRFLDAFLFDFRPSKVLKAGDHFELVVEEKYQDKQFVGYGRVLSAGLQVNNQMHRRSLYKYKGGELFIRKDDLFDQNRPLYLPVLTAKISSLYQPRRKHPVTRRTQAHHGIDFELPSGSPVYSAAAGKVIKMGYNRAAGTYVVIAHKNGLVSYYNHLLKEQSPVSLGQSVDGKTQIGRIGCTGYCTKEHLHFAVKKHGSWIDPIKLLRRYPQVVENELRLKYLVTAAQSPAHTRL